MPTSITKIDNYAAGRCIELPVFQDQLLEEPLSASAPGSGTAPPALITTASSYGCGTPILTRALKPWA